MYLGLIAICMIISFVIICFLLYIYSITILLHKGNKMYHLMRFLNYTWPEEIKTTELKDLKTEMEIYRMIKTISCVSIAYINPHLGMNLLKESYEKDIGSVFIIKDSKKHYLFGLAFKLEDTTYFVFRGTETIDDVIMDIHTKLVRPWFNKSVRIHEGFYKYFIQLLDQIRFVIDHTQPKDIVLMGTSLGGAIATMFAFYLSKWIKVRLYTIGTPKCGDQNFVDEINALESYNLVNRFDIVVDHPQHPDYRKIKNIVPIEFDTGDIFKNHFMINYLYFLNLKWITQ